MENPAGNSKTAGIHHRDTPSAGFTIPRDSPPLSKSKLSTMSEENEDQDHADLFDRPYGEEENVLSAEAQAHNISMFLCNGTSSTSDSGMAS